MTSFDRFERGCDIATPRWLRFPEPGYDVPSDDFRAIVQAHEQLENPYRKEVGRLLSCGRCQGNWTRLVRSEFDLQDPRVKVTTR